MRQGVQANKSFPQEQATDQKRPMLARGCLEGVSYGVRGEGGRVSRSMHLTVKFRSRKTFKSTGKQFRLPERLTVGEGGRE